MYTLFVFLFVVTFNFVLFRLMPGDPVAMLSKEIVSDPEARAAMEKLYGLDKPLPIQFLNYLKSMITFDFGQSFQYREDVWTVLKDKIAKESSIKPSFDGAPSAAPVASGDKRKLSEAVDALTVLGYNRSEILDILRKIDTAPLSLEEIITAALKQFAKP